LTLAIGALAAVPAVPTLLGAPGFVAAKVRPDVLIRFDIEESTIPKDLQEFASETARSFLVAQSPPVSSAAINAKSSANAYTEEFLGKVSRRAGKIDMARIEVVNQTNESIGDLFIRLDNVFSLWGIEASGSFLSQADAEAFTAKLAPILNDSSIRIMQKDTSVKLPKLPSLPPGSSMELTVYGNLEYLKPVVTTGRSSAIREVVEVEDGSLIQLINNPSRVIAFVPLLVYVVYLIARSATRHGAKPR
jgi:hypothetical protein